MDSHKLSFHFKHANNLRWGDLKNHILIPVKVQSTRVLENYCYSTLQLEWLKLCEHWSKRWKHALERPCQKKKMNPTHNILNVRIDINSLVFLQILNFNEHSLLMQTGCRVLLWHLLTLLGLIVSRFLRYSKGKEV